MISKKHKLMIIELFEERYNIILAFMIKEKYYYDKQWFENFFLNGYYIQINDVFGFTILEIEEMADMMSYKTELSKGVIVKRLCCLLVFLGRKISYRDLSEWYGTSASNVHSIIKSMVDLILKFKNDYIFLPAQIEFEPLSARFEKYSNLSGTVLAIDGTHVPITNVTTTLGRYINRKGYASLNFLVACDSFYRIRYVYGGTYGSSHDAYIYNSSSLSTWGEEVLNEPINGKQFHMVGDAAYPRKPYLITPFRGCLNREEARFNKIIIPQRILIERTFGQFKAKFQKFRLEIKNGHDAYTSEIFIAACVIYNMTIDKRMPQDFLNVVNDVIGEEITEENDLDRETN